MNHCLERTVLRIYCTIILLTWSVALIACGSGAVNQPATRAPGQASSKTPAAASLTLVVTTPPWCLTCNRTISWPSPTPTERITLSPVASATLPATLTRSPTAALLPTFTLASSEPPSSSAESAEAATPTLQRAATRFRTLPKGEIVFFDPGDQFFMRPADLSQPAELIYKDQHDKRIDLLQGISWAPDGKKFAFGITPWSDIAVYTLGAGDLVNLTKTDHYFESDPAWSPNGKLIALISNRRKVRGANTWDIYTMRADGSQIKLLYECNGRCSHPEWSPDGKQIAFMMDKDLYVMDNTGKKVRNLTRGVSLNRFPAWSPDGEWIAFVRSSDYDTQSYIYLVKPDGSGIKRLTDDTLWPRQLSWSPDGQFIAFENMGEPFGIVVYEVETGATALLAGVAYAPAWRPGAK